VMLEVIDDEAEEPEELLDFGCGLDLKVTR
jgi:hypothetical protein